MKIKETYNIENKETDYKIEKAYSGSPNLVVNWKNVPPIDVLKEEIQDGEKELAYQLTKIQEWHSYRDGEINFVTNDSKSRFVYRLVKKQATWQYPNLESAFLSDDKLLLLSDSMPMNRSALFQMQDLLNYQFTKENNVVDFINRFVRKTVDDGTCIIKLSWDRLTKKRETIIPIDDYEETDNIIDIVSENNGDGTMTVLQEFILKNQPIYEFCDIENIVIDPNCKGNISKARYVLHRFESTLSELKQDGRYSNLNKLTVGDLETIPEDYNRLSSLETLASNGISHIPNKTLIVNEYWGYYDIDGDGISEPVIVSWVNNTILRMEENPYPLQELPFVLVQCLINTDSVYGDSPTELIKDNQDIISATLRGSIDLFAQKAIGQKITRKGAFDLINKELLQAGEHCEVNAEHDPATAVFTTNYDDIPQTVPYFINFFNQEAESLTGIKAFSTNGISGDSMGSTATGVRSAVDAISKREASILRTMANGIIELAIKTARLDIELLSDEEIMLKTGTDEMVIPRDQYQPFFGMTIDISTPQVRLSKADRLAFLLQTVGNNMDEKERRLYQAQISRLEGSETMAKDIIEFEPEPNPLQEKIQQLEIQEKEAKIKREEAMANYYIAMAKQAGSDKDLKDLEFKQKIENPDTGEKSANE